MRIATIIICLLWASPSFMHAQYMTEVPHQSSKYYKEMFPPCIDTVKLLVVLPSQLSLAQIDTLVKEHQGIDLNKIQEYHIKTTEEAVIKVQQYVKMYHINCELVPKGAYSLDKYPASLYPLVVYPDSMVIDRYFVTFGYHIHDVAHDVNYGYLMGADPDLHDKYFKQLSTYISKLKKKKAKIASDPEASLKAETQIYQNQKLNKRMINYLAFPLGFAVAVGTFLLILTN